ncbi:SDR family NAD(P)-dependent oxidoreductase [Candidatus Poriferisocius sp.]|uniref:SDR family NAD(P)-dependent oxidoreductase n=1 Tax=Candidatus Poriferisocius sp. TaxID=3101276 RepID=UPI003B01879B
MGMLEGKTAIVTGGGQGVGRGIALALAAEGAWVTVAARTEAKVQAVAAEITDRGGSALAQVCDVNDLAQIRACVDGTVEHFGTIDILVNNAQQVPHGRLLEVGDEASLAAWTSGPLAAIRFMRLCHRYLRGGGVIINQGSGSSLKTDPSGMGVYAGVKSAMQSITRAAAMEWGADGIRAITLMPVAMSPAMEQWSETNPEGFAALQERFALKRVGDAEVDIGRVVAFLCSDTASYMTGTTVNIDGGDAYLR